MPSGGIRQLTEMLRRDNADEEPLEDGVDCEDNEGGELQCARQVDARVLNLFT